MRRSIPTLDVCLPRRAAAAAVLVAATVALTACGADSDATAAGDAGSEAGDAFPVSIEHKYGTTEIEEPPDRVVTLGYNEQDFALAFGVGPIAVRDWMGDRPYATFSWAEDELGGGEPEVLAGGELNFEQIAALRPDLILGTYSGITESDYEKLSRIAPTIAQSDAYVEYGMPWEEQTRMVGQALGRADEAERLIQEVEGRFAKARAEHPEFEGVTALFAYREDTGNFGVYSSQDPRGRFLASLGFRSPPDIDELAGDEFFARLSGERLRMLDRDVLMMVAIPEIEASRDELVADPLYRRLDVVREEGDVYPEEEIGAALSFSSPLSLPLAIDELVPQLAAAVDRREGGAAGESQ